MGRRRPAPAPRARPPPGRCSTTWSAWPRCPRACGPPARIAGNAQPCWDAADIEVFLHRLAFLAADGQRLRTDARTRICREVAHLLGRFRALGLTRPGGPAAGLAEDFTLATGDVPSSREDPEAEPGPARRDHARAVRAAPALELAVSCREIRVAVELIIDTGRRPDEICALRVGLPGIRRHRPAPVLIYDNHKNARLGRRLPIAQATAEVITAQKDRVRARFPDTPLAQLSCCPPPTPTRTGDAPITESHLMPAHRAWIKQPAAAAARRRDRVRQDQDRALCLPAHLRPTTRRRRGRPSTCWRP